MSATSEPWHLDKRVPVALIFAILAQTSAAIWWASSLSARVDQHDARLGRVENAAAARDKEQHHMAVSLARLDERLVTQTQILQRIETQLARRPTQ